MAQSQTYFFLKFDDNLNLQNLFFFLIFFFQCAAHVQNTMSPSMDKFDGTSCPTIYLKMYVRYFQLLGINNELLAQML